MYSNHGNHRWSLNTFQPILANILMNLAHLKGSWTFQGELLVVRSLLFCTADSQMKKSEQTVQSIH